MDLLQRDFQKNKDLVVDLLVKNVLSVNIEVPKVVKGNFWEPEDTTRLRLALDLWSLNIFSDLINLIMLFINNKYAKKSTTNTKLNGYPESD